MWEMTFVCHKNILRFDYLTDFFVYISFFTPPYYLKSLYLRTFWPRDFSRTRRSGSVYLGVAVLRVCEVFFMCIWDV